MPGTLWFNHHEDGRIPYDGNVPIQRSMQEDHATISQRWPLCLRYLQQNATTSCLGPSTLSRPRHSSPLDNDTRRRTSTSGAPTHDSPNADRSLLPMTMEEMQLEIGVSTSFLRYSYDAYGSLATRSWIAETWRFFLDSKIQRFSPKLKGTTF